MEKIVSQERFQGGDVASTGIQLDGKISTDRLPEKTNWQDMQTKFLVF